MYTTRIEGERNLGTAKTLNAAVMQIFGVKDAVVISNGRLVAFWCSARNEVRAGFGADPIERKSLGAK